MLWLLYNVFTGEGWVYGSPELAYAIRAVLGPLEWEVFPLA